MYEGELVETRRIAERAEGNDLNSNLPKMQERFKQLGLAREMWLDSYKKWQQVFNPAVKDGAVVFN